MVVVENKYHIVSYHNVMEDSYEHGEGQWVNSYIREARVDAKDVKSALEKFYETVLGFAFHEVSLYFDTEENVIRDATTVNFENIEMDNSELKKWRNGEIKGYVDSFHIVVYEMEVIDLKKLEWEKNDD